MSSIAIGMPNWANFNNKTGNIHFNKASIYKDDAVSSVAIPTDTKTESWTMTMLLKKADANGILKKDLPVRISFKDSYYTFESDDLEIVEGAETLKDGMTNFYNFIIEDYDMWKSTDNSKLTKDAIHLKNKFIEFLGK